MGRSSSHFTRTARIFAAELAVPHTLRVVSDLRTLSAGDYAGNPSLRVPVLLGPSGEWYGSLNICRELSRVAQSSRRIAWPEQLGGPLLANAQEVTLQAMASEVELIMSGSQGELASKRRRSLENAVGWLDAHVEAVLAALPERDLSYLETTLFCLTTHLEFRQVLAIEPFLHLRRFARAFAERDSAQRTEYGFDA